MGSQMETRIRHVTAVLGPTNTGKTHLAIERMLGHETGMIGLPLRLLAREVYDKISARVGADKVALVTGEEKIKPERARYWVSTVEAMPRDIEVDFLAIDEVQLAGDPERGHVFTDRLLNARGRAETLLLGAQTMGGAINDLIPGANFISRPRLSKLTYAGEKKITRLPARSAIVAFSASEVYAIAELVRRQRGGAAVVLGALSPRTRNAQVALYQSGDVDFLIATDAIGMGLNLDVDHVAFAAVRKFDGHTHRNLTPGELGQIAGRAGRHMNDGTFGVTGGVEPFDAELIEKLESHSFDNVRVLQWRNRDLEFGTLDALRESLRAMPREQRLTRARMADDVLALETLSADREVAGYAATPAAVMRLWEVCQIPDYRKISAQNHAELIGNVYKFLMSGDGRIPEDWFAKQVAFADRTDGDIDTLSNRIAHIRTWTFVSNRADWLKDPAHWQARTRAVEDQLSDAMHERLTQRFVDKRTSALMKGMRDKEELAAEIAEDGAINVENHYVGRLKGFSFIPDAQQGDGIHGKATRHAAAQVVSRELAMRVRRVASAKADAFKLTRTGRILWRDEEIAKFEPSENPLKPAVTLIADELLSAPDRERLQTRLDAWVGEITGDKLKPLVDIAAAEDVTGLARGIAFRLVENLGVLKRDVVGEELKSLDQTARAQLRKYGVRFGAFNIYFPPLLKPAAVELSSTLWALKHAPAHQLSLDALPEPPRPGLTSVATNPAVPDALYRSWGFHLCGPRAVRLDILERLADQIRPLLAYRAAPDNAAPPPKGSTGDGGFTVVPEMMSVLGCTGDDVGHVLKALGFRVERRPAPAATPTPVPSATPVAADGVASPTPADQPATAGVEAAAPAAEATVTPEAAAELPATVLADLAQPAAVAVADAAAAPAAEQFIEIWRPRRHKHEGGRRPQRDDAPGRERGDGRGRDRHRGHRRHGNDQRPDQRAGQQQGGGAAHATADAAHAAHPNAAPGEATTPQHADPAGAAPQGRGDRPGRREHRGGDRRPHERHGGGQGRPDRRPDKRDDKREGRRDGDRGGRDRRDRDKDRDRRPPGIVTSSPPRRAADPDSPFAALGALKEALEKRGKDSTNT